jgi:hypothetical protein
MMILTLVTVNMVAYLLLIVVQIGFRIVINIECEAVELETCTSALHHEDLSLKLFNAQLYIVDGLTKMITVS